MQGAINAKIPVAAVEDVRRRFNQNIRAAGDFTVQQMKLKSANDQFTESLRKQDLTLRSAYQQRKQFNSVLREQIQLQKMVTTQWGTDARGRMSVDAYIPRGMDAEMHRLTGTLKDNITALKSAKVGSGEFNQALDVLRIRAGLANQVLASTAHNMVNWGKNTQWAGRQLMVGLTMPVAAFAAVAGKAFYDVDKELTRIAKVYDTTATEGVAKERELAQVRQQSLQMATSVARQYGRSVQETLQVEASLAATGLKNQDLIKATTEVQRISMLGELDYQKAVEMTIAMQSAFGLSTEELTNKLNFMNAMENATNLSLQDFAETIPRAASGLAPLGVTVEQMGVLMAAMRDRGVDAAEGANALKSATTRIIQPTKAAREELSKFGINIDEIVEQAGGNLFKTLQGLAAQMEGLGNLDQQKIIAELFGTYQFNRLNAALAGITEVMQGVGEETSQTAMAMKVAEQSTESWANTADEETRRIQESASGRFKRTVETIKAELAKMGEPFLEIANSVLGWLTDVIRRFNDLPDASKKFMMIMIAAGAVAGPLIMLVGLFANLFGNILKVISGAAGLALRFKAMTAEERAMALATQQSTVMWSNQARAAQTLSAQLALLTRQFERVAVAQSQMTGTGITGFSNATGFVGPQARNLTQDANGRYRVASGQEGAGKFASAAEVAAFKSMQNSSQNIAQNAGQTASSWRTIGGVVPGLALGAAAMYGMVTSGGDLVTLLTTAALAATFVGPALLTGIKAVAPKITATLGTAYAAAGAAFSGARGAGVGGVLSGIRAAGPALARFGMVAMRLFGPAGLIASGALLFFKMRNEIAKAREEQEQLNNSAKDWADILGFVYTEASKQKGAEGNVNAQLDIQAKQIAEKNGALIKSLKEARNEQELLNRVIQEGLKIVAHGGNAQDVNQAVRAMLTAAGKNPQEISQILIRVKDYVDFADPEQVINESIDQFKNQFERISRNQFEQSKWEGFSRVFSGTGDLNQKAGAAAQGMAEQFYNTFLQKDEQGRRDYFNRFSRNIADVQGQLFNKLATKYSDEFKEHNIKNLQDLERVVNEQFAGRFEDIGIGAGDYHDVTKAIQAEEQLAKALVRLSPAGEEGAKGVKTLADAERILAENSRMAQMTVKEAEAAYNEYMARLGMSGKGFTDQQQLQILNMFRANAGLKEATSIHQGFGAAVANSTGNMKGANKAIAENTNLMELNKETAQDFVSARQEAMSGSRDAVMSRADDIMNDQMNNEIEAIRKRGERRNAALDAQAEAMDARFDKRAQALDRRWTLLMRSHDDRWDARMDREKNYYDARIERIQNAIKAEEKAEEQRQRIFEAEKARLERLANIFSANVDFNMALNSGNLDEAARIVSNIQSQQEQWALDDAAATGQTASEARKEKMQNSIDAIEKERERRLDSLRKIEEAEKRALEDKKERERQALDAERNRYKRAADAQRESLRQENENQQNALRRQWENRKRNLELELLAIRSSTPRNKAEFDNQVRQIEGAYNKYGVRLRAYGNAWSGYVGAALHAHVSAAATGLQSSINWKAIANKIANDFATGAFGMTLDQFAAWVTTGVLPPQGLKPPNPKAPGFKWAGIPYKNSVSSSSVTPPLLRHKGGPIGDGSRAGYPGSASPFPSEKLVLGKKGEFMMNDKAVNYYGTDFMYALNDKKVPMGGDVGLAGMAGAIMAGMMKAATVGALMRQYQVTSAQTMSNAAPGGMVDAIPGQAGKYGNIKLSAEQLRNAATIMGVGRGMGASTRDLIISIMTAMQESQLKNIRYGDRDSLGLFQQRPSQGWGTPAQVLDPVYASRKFFSALLKVKDRDKLPLTLAAQKVQRSAFPYAYAKWEAMARAVVSGTRLGTALAPVLGGGVAGGGFVRPMPGRITSRFGYRTDPFNGTRRFHSGTDIAAPTGTVIRSIGSGRVTYAGWDNNPGAALGNKVTVNHGNGYVSVYGHQSRVGSRVGQSVLKGQGIGFVGSTGRSTGPHLHLSIYRSGKLIDPQSVVPGLAQGGLTLNNGLAQLHAQEAVLTKPLTQQLKDGIANLDANGGTTYNIELTVNGEANQQTKREFKTAVLQVIQEKENNLGRKRKIG